MKLSFTPKVTTQLPYDVCIRKNKQGFFLVTIGCEIFAYTAADVLINDLEAYLTNPQEVLELFYTQVGPDTLGPDTLNPVVPNGRVEG